MWAARNSFLTAGSAGPEGDLYWDNVSALLQFDGSNGSTTITNSAANALSWTAFGNAQLSTAQSKYGSASLALGATADYIKPATANAALAFGTGDFTIELWAKFDNLTGVPALFDWRPPSQTPLAPGLFVGHGGTGKVNYYNGLNIVTTSSATLTTGVWYHLAVSRASAVTRVFINGVLDGTYNDTNNYVTNVPTFGALGYQPSLLEYDMDGYLDDIRITKGVARYVTNFDPPTEAFPVGPYTGPLTPLSATGGTVTEADGYRIHTFTSSGTFTVSALGDDNTLEYLVIGGGGGGGGLIGGGGGAGGYRCSVAGESSGGGSPAESPLQVSVGNYSVVVGAGGARGENASATAKGQSGGNSSFGSIIALGGGGGGGYSTLTTSTGLSGGSGGGSAGWTQAITGAAGTSGQGFAGGDTVGGQNANGGGGGAGSAGETRSDYSGGDGGNGLTSSITGSAVTRAGGGGGGPGWKYGGGDDNGGYLGGLGGSGGGGAGGSRYWTYDADADSYSAQPGLPNTGGGGGGARFLNPSGEYGAAGGSGIVIVRYRIAA